MLKSAHTNGRKIFRPYDAACAWFINPAHQPQNLFLKHDITGSGIQTPIKPPKGRIRIPIHHGGDKAVEMRGPDLAAARRGHI